MDDGFVIFVFIIFSPECRYEYDCEYESKLDHGVPVVGSMSDLREGRLAIAAVACTSLCARQVAEAPVDVHDGHEACVLFPQLGDPESRQRTTTCHASEHLGQHDANLQIYSSSHP